MKAVRCVTEVAAALIWDGGKFMICQRPAHKARGLLWEFVGGKVEPGETREQALVRECREELAVTVSIGEVFMDVVHEYQEMNRPTPGLEHHPRPTVLSISLTGCRIEHAGPFVFPL